jgi:hypothetical protein
LPSKTIFHFAWLFRFFAQLIGSKRGRVVAMATKNLTIFQQEYFPVEIWKVNILTMTIFNQIPEATTVNNSTKRKSSIQIIQNTD